MNVKNKLLIDICHVLCIEFEKNAKICFYSLADLNIGQCVELIFLEGKTDSFTMLTFLKLSFLHLLHFDSESE